MTSVLQNIREGMRVCDANGDDLGTVEFVHLTDEDASRPGAETVTVSPALQDEHKSLIDAIVDAFRTDQLPQPLQERLLRRGFIRVDANGLLSADRYVLSDQIGSVSRDRVMLSVYRDKLIKR